MTDRPENQPNVEALIRLIVDGMDEIDPIGEIRLGDYSARRLARFLASRGVLAVESISADDAKPITDGFASPGEEGQEQERDWLVRELARIARGGEEG